MSITIIFIYKIIIIFPILGSSIIWRINVNYINLFFVGIIQNRKCMIIITFNQNIDWFLRITPN